MAPWPLEVMLILRFLKLLAVIAFGAGTLGTFVPERFEDRQRFAYYVAGPGWGATWFVGVVMAFGGGASLLSAWIVGAVVLSMVTLQIVLFCGSKDGRRSARAATVAMICLIACVALMLWKPTLG